MTNVTKKLFDAVRKGDVIDARSLIKQGADPKRTR